MGTDQQQFCLRWHSYQSSLLATLPQLLDGNDLTDVTLSAGGRNLRAHKVILSACSQYFKDLFKELQPFQHPVIVLPGMNFPDLCALVTFMYSGEVNIYQHQLSGLLTMADVLHIRGLSEVGSEAGSAGMDSLNPVIPSAKRDPKSPTCTAKRAKLSTVSPPSTHLTSPQDRERELAAEKKIKESAVDYALYGKRTWDQTVDSGLYTNGALPQEVAENLVTLDTKANLSTASQYQALTEKMVTELYSQKVSVATKKSTSDRLKNYEQTLATMAPKSCATASLADNFLRVKTEQELGASATSDNTKTATSGKHTLEKVDADDRKGVEFSPSRLFPENAAPDEKADSTPIQGLDLSQAVTSSVANTSTTISSTNSCSNSSATGGGGNNNNNNNSPNSKCSTGVTSSPVTTPSGHTKLYATCFVCGKQLSNQYNLRVHMETHQNVQYACSICSHVSRSKDALRKHVSYRHPAPVDGSSAGGGGAGSGSSAAAKREARKLKAEQLVSATTAPSPSIGTTSAATSATSTTSSGISTGSSTSNVSPMETL